jgi:hypothetical protein
MQQGYQPESNVGQKNHPLCGCKKAGGLLGWIGSIIDLGPSIPIDAIDPFLLTVRLRYRDLTAIAYSRSR